MVLEWGGEKVWNGRAGLVRWKEEAEETFPMYRGREGGRGGGREGGREGGDRLEG